MHFKTENFDIKIWFIVPFLEIRDRYAIEKFFMWGWSPWKLENKRQFVYSNKLS